MGARNTDRRSRTVRWQGMASLSLLTVVAACGSQPGGGPVSSQSYAPAASRPSSYNPPGPSSDPWGPYIQQASRRFDIPERWVREVMRQESGGRSTATSPVGAMGLMQVMPGTYTELRYKHGLGDDPYHPYDSIMAGTAYIRQMYDLYGSPGFLAAYNGGPRRFEDYLYAGRSMPAETRNYVARIGPRIVDAHPARRAPPEVYAAAEIPLNVPAGPRRADSGTMLALREQREQRRASDAAVQVATLPPGPVTRMDPIPDGSTYAQPFQVASLAGTVVRMDPIPDGSTYATPIEPVGTVVRMEPIPNPVESPRQELAFAPSPAPWSRPEPNSSSLPPPPEAPAKQFTERSGAAPGPRTGLLIGSAQASTLPSSFRAAAAAASPSSASWAVQVGAFASENLARAAAGQARDQIGAMGVRVAVQPVLQGRTTLYRARVVGLSRDTAQSACDRLRSRGACMTLSPDAQG